MISLRRSFLIVIPLILSSAGLFAQSDATSVFNPKDVFELEWAADPQIAPSGSAVVYVRSFFDIMTDRPRSNLWYISASGTGHRPLTTGKVNYGSPRWSPDGEKLAYTSTEDGSNQIYVRWMDDGQTAKIANLTTSPSSLTWSPDGRWIAFTTFVAEDPATMGSLPSKPDDATWAPPARVIDKMLYRSDGAGYLQNGRTHIFVVPSDGGTPRQLTTGPYDHEGSLSWADDGSAILFSANRHENHEQDPLNSEVYRVNVNDGTITALTSRQGPDFNPIVSPDGRRVAFLGFDDRLQGYQVTRLYTMNIDGSDVRLVTGTLDRDVESPRWIGGNRIAFLFDEHGNTKLATTTLTGATQTVVGNVGGLSLGRPYNGGSFSATMDGSVAYTESQPDHPAELAFVRIAPNAQPRILTDLNGDLFDHKTLAQVEEIWYESSFDGRQIQGWIATPPNFDTSRKYPLLLEIHGGPFANYGDRFAAEIQLYAAAGYVVFYANPRGSTSYGEEFGNLIHHNYPSEDYNDLMDGVDAVIAQGYIDQNNLFVTGGSGGGVLSSWIVGKTDRFQAAVVAKPVINWYSFVLTSDAYNFFTKYWFPGEPWEHQDHYMARSPISLVGNVSTPTMLLTGEADYRTPISESEQYYQALQLRGVPSALVRIPEASHGITSRPSNLIAKVSHVLEWFRRYQRPIT